MTQQDNKVQDEKYDIVIVGGGPAAMTAGIYAARAEMNVLLIESIAVMGQMVMTEAVENYPGVERASGFELVSTFKKQAESFGLKCSQGTVRLLSCHTKEGSPTWQIKDENGECEALSVIIASGASPQKLGVAGEEKFLSKGVSYCATCDGPFFRDKDIIVIGGGDTAVEEALFLARFGRKVTIIHRRDRLRATKLLQKRAFSNGKIGFIWDSEVERIGGGDKVEWVGIRNVKTDEKTKVECEGVFVFVGWVPNTDFLKSILEMDEYGAIIVDSEMKTSTEGVFAAGDCCKKLLRQIVTACGDGATAAFSAQHYVEKLKGTAYE